ncbi:SDR family oxidoreductase [Spirillospora sp. NPDC029432]|uniref:SDR family NAD(P)-dependent oxidoreductase n=1 Tax=Spirillospora sp. NPDC029432 TaxID=3154599 RepID=UPI003455716A
MRAAADDTVPPVVIVTGGGTGIGRSTARAFADEGARVLIVGRSRSTLDECAKGYDDIHPVVADITDPNSPARIVRAALDGFGRIDVLVNNAAVGRFGGLADIDRETVEAMFGTNLFAPILLAQQALDALEATRGVVVNVGTAGALGLRSWPDNALYGASKAALDFLTRSWAVELAPRGIRVVGVAPGIVNTGVGVRAGMSPEAYDGFLEHMRARIPSGRIARPEEIAWWITRLAGPEAEYVNGTVLALDGALSVT